MKITKDKHFIDWFSNVFGYGYGTGERPVLEALNVLMIECAPSEETGEIVPYNYRNLEAALGASAAWLLINALCKDDILTYGSSPRFAWLTRRGEMLREFMSRHTLDELEEILDVDIDTDSDNFYYRCFPGCCTCMPEKEACNNPMFDKSL